MRTSENHAVFRHNAQPLYAQIKESLRERILEGDYREHERIPSESELMSRYGVSRITVRQALSDLENEQLIFRIPGKGSFVLRPKPTQQLVRLQGFAEAMSSLGLETHNRLISLMPIDADPAMASRLQVPEGSPLSEIRRVRYADHAPISLDVTYVRRTLGLRLAREDLANRDIFVIIENDYQTPLGHADLRINAINADSALSALLHIPVGAPILRMERLTWSKAGQPIDFEFLYYRGDSFCYQLRAERE
ncbi:transcriptional regulator [Betaproteobacteria bacterium]|nr:transcriptional regulator [Betaproteobacteria bacterium]GHU15272.1 transcriptional regulator [Betaproteobacteria bacterium]GHU40736.1 transcriptional regulator [Betaproteobacteria bacterium]